MALGWGLIGASGVAADLVLPALRESEGSDPVAVFSSSGERGRRYAAEHGIPAAHESLEDLLADPAVDAVYISTTNDLHAAQTIAAAVAGKHVLCEKPLALTVADGLSMRAVCDAAGVVLATNFHLRAAGTHRAMRDLTASGSIGQPLAARIFLARYLPEELRTWRVGSAAAGGGVVLDNGVHAVDLLRFLLGEEVVEVASLAAIPRFDPDGAPDHVMSSMRLDSGVLAYFHDAFTVPHAGTGVEVHGTDASLIARETLGPRPTGEVVLRRGDDCESIEVVQPESLYLEGVRAFEAAVDGRGRPLADADDGIASLAVALAVLESARTGRAVVPAPRLNSDTSDH